MTVIYPEATPVQGNTKVKAVLTVADTAAPKLATEINATSSVDVSFFLHDWAPTATQNKGTAPRRVGDTAMLDKLGNTNFSIPTLTYVYDPQGDDTTSDNKAKALLAEGTEVYLIERLGLSAKSTDFAVTQKVRVHHVRVGTQVHGTTGTDEFSEYQISQEVEYVEVPADGVIAT